MRRNDFGLAGLNFSFLAPFSLWASVNSFTWGADVNTATPKRAQVSLVGDVEPARSYSQGWHRICLGAVTVGQHSFKGQCPSVCAISSVLSPVQRKEAATKLITIQTAWIMAFHPSALHKFQVSTGKFLSHWLRRKLPCRPLDLLEAWPTFKRS